MAAISALSPVLISRSLSVFWARSRLVGCPATITMGWLRIGRSDPIQHTLPIHDSKFASEQSDHVEFAENTDLNKTFDKYPVQPESKLDNELPYIPSAIVQGTKLTSDRLWIVVDDIVYDCTQFVQEHPGGNTVIESFRGENCSWQFWRFHNKTHLKESGRPLRVGRTSGIKNRFKEPTRFVGLRKIGADDW